MTSTIRKTGWCIAFLSYVCAFLFWGVDTGEAFPSYILLLATLVGTIIIVVLAVKSKCYDLWAAAIIAAISFLIVPVWSAPFFSAR